MGALFRLLIFALVIYIVVRWLMNLGQPRQRPQRAEKPPPPSPFPEKDIVDAKFTEIPPEEKN